MLKTRGGQLRWKQAGTDDNLCLSFASPGHHIQGLFLCAYQNHELLDKAATSYYGIRIVGSQRMSPWRMLEKCLLHGPPTAFMSASYLTLKSSGSPARRRAGSIPGGNICPRSAAPAERTPQRRGRRGEGVYVAARTVGTTVGTVAAACYL